MHMPPTTVPMPNQTKTRHPMHTRCPQPITNTYLTLHKLHGAIHRIRVLNDRFPEQAITHIQTKYDPLIQNIQTNRWIADPLITIIDGVRGAIHEHSNEQLTKLKLPKSSKMKNLHQNAIKYLTYLVLTKGNLITNKPLPPPYKRNLFKVTPPETASSNRHNTPYCIMGNMISIGLTGSHSCWYMVRALFFFSFLSW